MFNLSGGDPTNPLYSSSGRNRAEEALAPTSWAFLTCNDLVMEQVIERILGIEPTVVVRQSDRASIDALLLSAETRSQIDHAVRDCGIRNFMVCGHSFCSTVPLAKLPPLLGSTSGGYAGLVERVRQREGANRRAREMVVRRLCAVDQYLTCDHGLDPRHFMVEGVFYLCESGVLSIYEHAQERFVAIAGHISRTC
jgi:carbonic anhydrase